MDQQLQKALADLLNGSIAALKQGAIFMQEQLPDVIRQLLIWKATQSGIWFAAFLALLVLSIWAIRRFWAWMKAEGAEELVAVVTVPLFAGAVAVVEMICNLDWLQIIIAPKVYLIEYAAHVLK